jgi:hypothetical protein
VDRAIEEALMTTGWAILFTRAISRSCTMSTLLGVKDAMELGKRYKG